MQNRTLLMYSRLTPLICLAILCGQPPTACGQQAKKPDREAADGADSRSPRDASPQTKQDKPPKAKEPDVPAGRDPAPAKKRPPGDPVPKLLQNLDDAEVRVAAAAARSLGVIFSPGGRGGKPMEEAAAKLITKLESRQGGLLRREAAVALGKMRAAEALPGLKQAMKDEDFDVAMAAAGAIADILPVDEARKFLLEQGESESESVRLGAYDALAPIAKAEDSEFFIAGLDAPNWRIQAAACRGLERAVRLGARIDAAVYDRVAGVLGSEVSTAANAALHFLTHIRNEESIRATIAAVAAKGDGGNDDSTWRTRTFALRTLQHQGGTAIEQGLPAVIRQLGDRTANVTNEARRVLNLVRRKEYLTDGELYRLLLKELESAQSLSLQAGIMAELDTSVPQQYASRVAKVAEAALDAASRDKEAWPAQWRAIRLLGASGYTGAIEQIAASVAHDVPNVRQAAGQALEQLSPLADQQQKAAVAAALQELIEQPVDWRKTAIAARAAGYYPSEQAIGPLVKLLSHSVVNVKDAASHSLSRIVSGTNKELAAQVEQPLFAAVAEDKRAWEYGAKVLGATKNGAATDLLLPILKQGNWRAQANAASAVSQIAAANKLETKELSETLIKVAQSDVAQVREAANKALRAIAKEQSPGGS